MILFDSLKEKSFSNIYPDGKFYLKPGDFHSFSIPCLSRVIKVKFAAKNNFGDGLLSLSVRSDKKSYMEKIFISSSKFDQYSFEFAFGDIPTFIAVDLARESGINFGKVEIARLVVQSKDKKEVVLQEELVKKTERSTVYCVIPYGIYGGAEVYLKDLINATKKENVFFNLLYLHDKNNLKTFFKDDIYSSARNFSDLSEMKKWITKHPPDIFLYYNRKDIYDLAIDLKKSGVTSKIVEIYHSDFVWPGAVANLNHREDIDTMIVTYPELGTQIKGVFERRTVPIPIDTVKFSKNISKSDMDIGLFPGKKVIGTVARLSKEKNIDYILDLAIQMGDFEFLIVGDGPEGPRLKNRVQKEKIINVTFAGHQDDPSRYYHLMNAFVLCSDMEGTSISVLEAMSSSVLVFSNFVGGISSILEEEHSGIRVFGNAREDANIIRSNINRMNVVSNARQYVERNHSVTNCSKLFLSALLGNIDLFNKKARIPDSELVISGEFI